MEQQLSRYQRKQAVAWLDRIDAEMDAYDPLRVEDASGRPTDTFTLTFGTSTQWFSPVIRGDAQEALTTLRASSAVEARLCRGGRLVAHMDRDSAVRRV